MDGIFTILYKTSVDKRTTRTQFLNVIRLLTLSNLTNLLLSRNVCRGVSALE